MNDPDAWDDLEDDDESDDDLEDDDDLDSFDAEDAVVIGGYPTCPACGDSLFIPHHSNDRLVFCDRDATLIRLPRPDSG